MSKFQEKKPIPNELYFTKSEQMILEEWSKTICSLWS